MEGWRQPSSVCLGEDASSRCSLYSWTLIAPSGEEVEHIGIGLKAKQCEDSGDAPWPSRKSVLTVGLIVKAVARSHGFLLLQHPGPRADTGTPKQPHREVDAQWTARMKERHTYRSLRWSFLLCPAIASHGLAIPKLSISHQQSIESQFSTFFSTLIPSGF